MTIDLQYAFQLDRGGDRAGRGTDLVIDNVPPVANAGADQDHVTVGVGQ